MEAFGNFANSFVHSLICRFLSTRAFLQNAQILESKDRVEAIDFVIKSSKSNLLRFFSHWKILKFPFRLEIANRFLWDRRNILIEIDTSFCLETASRPVCERHMILIGSPESSRLVTAWSPAWEWRTVFLWEEKGVCLKCLQKSTLYTGADSQTT